MSEGSASRQIARAAGTVMVAFVLSNLTSLARQILVADAFGTELEMEAFTAANRVSETLFTLVAGGALASSFIPNVTALLVKDKRAAAWKLASAIANLALLALTLVSLLAAIFAPQIVRHFLAPGFAGKAPGLEELTIDLLRLMLPSTVFFGLSGLVMGMLNAHQVFFVPALTPSFYQLGMILGVVFLAPKMGIYGLGWGVVAGSALHLLLQVPALLRLPERRYWPTFGRGVQGVGMVLRLLGPRLFGAAVVELNFWVNTNLASFQPEGSLPAILYGRMLMIMPQAALAQSVATAAMPTLAAQFARGETTELRRTLAASLRGVLVLALPATLGLILLRQPLVAMLYQRGAFDALSTELVAWALLWYAAGLVGHCIVEVLARAFYAMQDTRTPVLVGASAMGLNVVFSILFAALFTQWGWMPHGGLALGNSLATGLEALLLLWLMWRRLEGLEGRSLLQVTVQAALATLGMGAILAAWLTLSHAQPAWVIALGGVFVGGGLYALLVLLLGVEEARRVRIALMRRLRR
jgi:putative peptidoglycan lipid II flippase